MNVRWVAVIIGFVVDVLVTLVLTALVYPSVADTWTPDLSNPRDIAVIVIGILSTGVGGYVAGRVATSSRTMNGLLVAIVRILFGQLSSTPLPKVLVLASVVGCGAAALGGYLSRFPAQHVVPPGPRPKR